MQQLVRGELPDPAVIEALVVDHDLSRLNAGQRVSFYRELCSQLGLNWAAKPFGYLRLNNKLTLYALKNCADQLRQKHSISIEIVARQTLEDAKGGSIYVVSARATTPGGRTDEDDGAVAVSGLSGERYCNALLKATTKAKRRVTLSLCGLGGMMDETEVASVSGARVVAMRDDGEPASAPRPRLAVNHRRLESAADTAPAVLSVSAIEAATGAMRSATTRAEAQRAYDPLRGGTRKGEAAQAAWSQFSAAAKDAAARIGGAS